MIIIIITAVTTTKHITADATTQLDNTIIAITIDNDTNVSAFQLFVLKILQRKRDRADFSADNILLLLLLSLLL